MDKQHFQNILLRNHIVTKGNNEYLRALKLIRQKEKFILEDAAHAVLHNRKIKPSKNGRYTLKQLSNEVNKITNQYYHLYIKISQFETYLRTLINHRMIDQYGRQWHTLNVMHDLRDFQNYHIQTLSKPSQALNSISFGTLVLIIFNGGRYINVFRSSFQVEKILNENGNIKYNNKGKLKKPFSIIRNARNDVCHHRRLGESMRQNPRYRRSNMSRSDVLKALNDLKILLEYDDELDVVEIQLKYKKI